MVRVFFRFSQKKSDLFYLIHDLNIFHDQVCQFFILIFNLNVYDTTVINYRKNSNIYLFAQPSFFSHTVVSGSVLHKDRKPTRRFLILYVQATPRERLIVMPDLSDGLQNSISI